MMRRKQKTRQSRKQRDKSYTGFKLLDFFTKLQQEDPKNFPDRIITADDSQIINRRKRNTGGIVVTISDA